MTRFFCQALALAGMVAVLALTPAAQAADKLKIVTTFTVIADMAANVAGEHAEVVSITRPGAEVHNYKPTPRDLVKAQGADLILWNGLNLERWFERFFTNLHGVPEVTVSEGIDRIMIDGDAYDGKPNPHAWMSISAAQIYVDNIRDALMQRDPANAAAYADNAAAYKAKIAALAAPLHEALDGIAEERRWLATSEGAFSYLARDFGLRELYLWPINADGQGTPQQVRAVIDAMREHAIPVIFSESTVSPKPAQQVARETGATYGGMLYVDSLSEPDGPVPTYLDMMRVTIGTIAGGLKNG
ncbi:MAG: metal ABC transporter substrate-binding protein [Brucellaceae bacterium]|uniref:metal ABC transporter substrate-binding protein n=1 Tax=Zhengella sp. TaxID=2282762 RepID=UPI0035296FC6|nr:metal ABC transporter substrate-binding protein [Brucellaceae bacterium]